MKPTGDAPKIDIKRVLPVGGTNNTAQPNIAMGGARIESKKSTPMDMMINLYGWLGDETKSMSTAAAYQNDQGTAHYTATLIVILEGGLRPPFFIMTLGF